MNALPPESTGNGYGSLADGNLKISKAAFQAAVSREPYTFFDNVHPANQ